MAKKTKNKENIKIPDTLVIIAGFVTLIAGIISAIIGNSVEFWLLGVQGITIGIWGILCGALMIFGYILARENKNRKNGFNLVLVFSILALITAQGWLIGPLLGVVGSIMGLIHK